jgi:hypothetical protein
LPESVVGEEQTSEERDAHLERARVDLSAALRTPAGRLKKNPSALELKTKIRVECRTVDQVCKALAHVASLKEKSILERLSRCWEWIDVDKRLAEAKRPLAPSDELRSLAAELLKQYPRCTAYDYTGGHVDSKWGWNNVRKVRDNHTGEETLDFTIEIDVLARVILYFQEVEKCKKARVRIKGARIRDLRNGLRREHPHCRDCKETGHIYHKIFQAGADSAHGITSGRIDDGHIVLAGLYMEYVTLKRVEKVGTQEFSYGGSLHFDKVIERFKGMR